MASVEVENQQAKWTRYAIRLRFGVGAGTYIGVEGPFGGVRLAVRDVNGDDSLDLVLTSVVDRHVIQVLLNDGHGNFTRAEPDANWLSTRDSERSWSRSDVFREEGSSSTSSRWSFDGVSFETAFGNGIAGAALSILESTARSSRTARSCQGRAPPEVVQQS